MSHGDDARRFKATIALVVLLGAGCRESPHTPPTQTRSPPTSSRVSPLPSTPTPSPTPTASPTDRACVTFAAIGASPLTDDATFAQAPDAVTAVRKELLRLLDQPRDYHAVVEAGGDLVVVEVWPSSLVTANGCVDPARRDEKSRTLTYDVKTRRIMGTRWSGDR